MSVAQAEPGLLRFPPGTRRSPDGGLLLAGCDARALADEFGTPLLVFDAGALRDRAQRLLAAFAEALPGREVAVAYASKACPCPPVLAVLAQTQLLCDVASGGELALAQAGGFDGSRLILHGNAKRDSEIAAALEARVGLVVVDGPDDLERLERLGAVGQPVLLRVTPGVEAATHPAIRTGHRGSKFGIPLDLAGPLVDRLRRSPAVELRGLHIHLGSQILDLAAFGAGVAALAGASELDTVDVGGGLGIAYRRDDDAPTIEGWAQAIGAAVAEHLPQVREVIVEPGRSLVGPAAVTLYRVVTVKDHGDGPLVAVDGGLSDNLEPLYGVRFDAVHADRPGGGQSSRIVGLQCEEGDTLGEGVPLDRPRVGDLLAVPSTGAYTYSLASNYNGALRAAVVLADAGQAEVVVRRETWADVVGRLV